MTDIEKQSPTQSPTKSIVFRPNLPFRPADSQVIYIEKEYDPRVNALLRDNYDRLQTALQRVGLTLCYLPYVSRSVAAEEIVRYFTPYRDSSITQVLDSTCLNDYLKRGQHASPSLILYAGQEKDYYRFHQFPLDGTEADLTRQLDAILSIVEEREARRRAEQEARERERANRKTFYCNTLAVSLPDEENERSFADQEFPEEVTKLMDDVRTKIAQLQQYGINQMALQRLLMPRVVLSRLRITRSGRILLPGYNNLEIKMPPLVKAVYFLFLRHSEGIAFKALPDYRHELTTIYEHLTGRLNVEQVRQSVLDVTDPCKNSINEKCARIREAFLREFDDSMARYYYVTGDRACPKGIALDRTLVEWEGGPLTPCIIVSGDDLL